MRRRYLALGLGCVLALSVGGTAQDADRADPREFEVAGATVQVGEDIARISRDGGTRWTRLAKPDYRVMLRYGTFDPLESAPTVPAALRASATNELFLVQFMTTITDEYRAALEDAGVAVYRFIPWQCAVVRMPRALTSHVASLPFVRWVGEFHTAYRLEEELIDELVASNGFPTRRYNVMPVDWSAQGHAALVARLREAGVHVVNEHRGSILVDVGMTDAQMRSVMEWNDVLWIDRWTPIEKDVDIARIQGGADYLEPQSPNGYTGKGIRGYNTEGIFDAHTEFAATPYRSAPIRHTTTLRDSHGNSVNGIIFARGVSALYRGLVPDAQCIAASSGAIGSNRDSMTAQAVDPNDIYRAMFMTASWGGGRTTLYTSVSSQMDDILFKYDLAHTQSQSNAGAPPSRPQAWAKNMISVGGFRHQNTAATGDDTWSNSGSIGPASDGRIKPDISAYYDNIRSTGSTGTNYTTSFGGTSGATPTTAGHVGLLLEMFTDGAFGHQFATTGNAARFTNRPHMTTTKCMLVNFARQYSFSGTGHDMTRVHQGYGMPNVQDAWDKRKQALVLNELDVLTQGASKTYLVWVKSGTPELKVSMNYADPAGAANASVHRINDLTLKVTAPDNTVYWGNNGLLTGNYSTSGGSANTIDTLENVFVQNPASGIWAIEVTATSVAQDGHTETAGVDADFALVASGLGAGRDDSGAKLSLISSSAGDLRVQLTSLPAGYTEGWVLFSLDTSRQAGFGEAMGLRPDTITALGYSMPAVAGSPFHFPNHAGASFPNTTYAFAPAVANALTGIEVDGLAMFANGGVISGFSNVSRVKVQ